MFAHYDTHTSGSPISWPMVGAVLLGLLVLTVVSAELLRRRSLKKSASAADGKA